MSVDGCSLLINEDDHGPRSLIESRKSSRKSFEEAFRSATLSVRGTVTDVLPGVWGGREFVSLLRIEPDAWHKEEPRFKTIRESSFGRFDPIFVLARAGRFSYDGSTLAWSGLSTPHACR